MEISSNLDDLDKKIEDPIKYFIETLAKSLANDIDRMICENFKKIITDSK